MKFFVLVTLAVATLASAQTNVAIPTGLPSDRKALTETEQGDSFTSLGGIVLGKTNLYEIRKKLGKTKIIRSGDAGGFEAKIGYYYPEQKTNIQFFSGELGGDELELLGFEVSHSCIKPSRSIAIEDNSFRAEAGKLRLGLSMRQFEAVVGAVKQSEDGLFYHEFKSSIMIKDKPFDVIILVNGQFQNDSLVKFSVYKTVTN